MISLIACCTGLLLSAPPALVATVVDDLDGDALMFACEERQGGRAAEVFKTLRGDDGFESAGRIQLGFTLSLRIMEVFEGLNSS